MGLCKCPRKCLTKQFCFEHKVNVCEYCMVEGQHKTCIIGPYLRWLEDSNYDTKCYCCQNELSSANCIRLRCYDIFHLDCLDSYARKLPPNTAPAGYVCPICSKPIFSDFYDSPLSNQIHQILSYYPWAAEGLKDVSANLQTTMNDQISYSALFDDSTKINMSPMFANNVYSKNNQNIGNKLNHLVPNNTNNVSTYITTHNNLNFGSTSSIRSKFDNEYRRPLLPNVDEYSEDKYRTKSPTEFLSRWLRTHSTFIKNQPFISSLGIYKRIILYGFLAILFVFILIHYMIKYGRQHAEDDPFLDPEFDPNIRNIDN